jgi:uncharacterized protein (TIGR03032 family)
MSDPTFPTNDEPDSVCGVHSSNLPELLETLGISLVVTTYQADRLVVIRSDSGTIDTRCCRMDAPMGLAFDGVRLVVGTRTQVCEFRNHPRAGKRIPPLGKHDACFLPRRSHTTGDIRAHEMDWIGDELWIVNTRCSCLCTLDPNYNFVPRWRPPFISGLAVEDRCHLNGLAIIDGKPKYVTSLGTTDTRHGWRDNAALGGCLLDVESGETVASGLSMPHSPRWHSDQLWVLESGRGTIATVNVADGRLTTVAALSGFVRGLDFVGPYAFVGLSQVRKSAIFSGIPISENNQQTFCGIWVVDTRSGQTVAFFRFEDSIQEVFAVRALPGMRYVEIRNETSDLERLISDSFAIPPQPSPDATT